MWEYGLGMKDHEGHGEKTAKVGEGGQYARN